MKIGKKEFEEKGHTYVMGILNITPDSFSDGGKYNEMDKALYHVKEMISEGADIIDIGGESTRPGYVMISEEEETGRVIPVIEKVKSEFDVPVALDTYKSGVAKAGIKVGADMINDIWGLKYDPKMAEVIAEAGVCCCLAHNRKEANYQSCVEEVLWELDATIEIARKAGIDSGKMILDPGIGFGKTYENNLEVINRLEMMNSLGVPFLLGASRKSVIGLTLDLPVTERVEGTIATTVYAVLKGAMFVRVHDVKENVRAIKMIEAIRDGHK